MATDTTVLEKAGFTRINREAKRRLIISAEGDEGTGKTTWALTAPAPIVILNLDLGTEGIIENFPGKEIYAVGPAQGLSLPSHKDPNKQKTADRAWGIFLSEYEKALDSSMKPGGARTIIIDTATDLWALARLAVLGKLSQVQPHNYVEVNAWFEGVINAAFDYNANLICLHKIKLDFDTKKPERDGFKYMNNIAQVMVKFNVTKQGGIDLKVLKCRQNSELHLEKPTFPVYEPPDEDEDGKLVPGKSVYDFARFAAEVIRGSRPSEWR